MSTKSRARPDGQGSPTRVDGEAISPLGTSDALKAVALEERSEARWVVGERKNLRELFKFYRDARAQPDDDRLRAGLVSCAARSRSVHARNSRIPDEAKDNKSRPSRSGRRFARWRLYGRTGSWRGDYEQLRRPARAASERLKAVSRPDNAMPSGSTLSLVLEIRCNRPILDGERNAAHEIGIGPPSSCAGVSSRRASVSVLEASWRRENGVGADR